MADGVGQFGGGGVSRKVLILANVGNRDVLLDGEALWPPREKGAEILERFNKVARDVALPIVSPALRHIGSSGWEVSESPDVGLFYTDQGDERFRGSDTVEFAKIMKRKLLDEFPRREESGGVQFSSGKSIFTKPIRESPARYDDMYGFYRDYFAGNAHIREPEGWLCFVLTSGGTPAMNAMLILHAVQHFGENCVQIYVSPEGEAHDMRVGEEIVRAAVERRFDDALAASQFRAAAEILEDGERGGYRASACRYAEHRLAFDFRGADRHCREALKKSEGDARRWLEGHSRLAQKLQYGASDPSLLIEELFYNLEVKWVCGEYVDVLGRSFRLAEALRTWIIESNTPIRNDGKTSLKKQKSEIIAIPGLWERIEKKLDIERPELNRFALTTIMEYMIEAEAHFPEEARERVARVMEGLEKIDKLAELRNKTILAHGFEGVSRERLEAEYGSDSLIEDLRESVGDALGRDLSENPFFELAARLKF